MFTVDQDIVGPFILDDARTWQMSRRSKISLLVFCAVLLRPEKLELLWGITVNCNAGLSRCLVYSELCSRLILVL